MKLRNNLLLVFTAVLVSLSTLSQVNNNCASATTLTSNAAQLCSQSTSGGSVQVGETITAATVCASSNYNQTIWYRFTATSTSMFLEIELESVPSGTWCPTRFSTVVYNTGTCMPAAASKILCESSFSDGGITLNLTTLTVGNSYLVQVGYNDGSGCKIPGFCIRVGDNTPQCTCSSVCSHGCGYATTPTVTQVTTTCPEYELNPLSDGGETHTYCYDFIAINSTVSYNMIITSNCGAGGNVTALTWTLQTPTCGANVATGSLASMQATGLTVGQTYVLCYTYTIPTTCHHSSLYPYFVGAQTPLPIEIGSLVAYNYNGKNYVKWSSYSEMNSDYFIVERSTDGENFIEVGKVKGAGESTAKLEYEIIDNNYRNTINYYRLTQFDFDGNSKSFDLVMVDNSAGAPELIETINLLGQPVDALFRGIVIDVFDDGSTRKRFQ